MHRVNSQVTSKPNDCCGIVVVAIVLYKNITKRSANRSLNTLMNINYWTMDDAFFEPDKSEGERKMLDANESGISSGGVVDSETLLSMFFFGQRGGAHI